VWRGAQEAILAAAFNSKGPAVLTTSLDNSARIWSVANGRTKAQLGTPDAAHFLPVPTTAGSATISPDDNFVLWMARDGSARISETAHGHSHALIGHRDSILSAEF